MPKIWFRKTDKRHHDMADFFVRDGVGHIVTHNFCAAANDILEEKYSEVGNGGFVYRSWVQSLQRRNLGFPKLDNSELKEFEPPTEVRSFAEIESGASLNEPDGAPLLHLVRGPSWNLCLTLPSLPYSWLESASPEEWEALRKCHARFELGPGSVEVKRLRHGPHDLDVPLRLFTNSIKAELPDGGDLPPRLDLSGHLQPNGAIQNGLMLFFDNALMASYTRESAAPGDRFVALHRPKQTAIVEISTYCAVTPEGSLHDGEWLVSRIELPANDDADFKAALKLLKLRPTAMRWAATLLLPLSTTVIYKDLHLIQNDRPLVIQVRRERRGTYAANFMEPALLAWVSEIGAEHSMSIDVFGNDAILELPYPGVGRWDLYIYSKDGFPACLSLLISRAAMDQPWMRPEPLTVRGTWGAIEATAQAWDDPTLLDVRHTTGSLEASFTFEPIGLPASVSSTRSFEDGSTRKPWRYPSDIAADVFGVLRTGESAEFVFEADAFGSARFKLTARSLECRPDTEERTLDPLLRWRRTVALANRGAARSNDSAKKLVQMASLRLHSKDR